MNDLSIHHEVTENTFTVRITFHMYVCAKMNVNGGLSSGLNIYNSETPIH